MENLLDHFHYIHDIVSTVVNVFSKHEEHMFSMSSPKVWDNMYALFSLKHTPVSFKLIELL